MQPPIAYKNVPDTAIGPATTSVGGYLSLYSALGLCNTTDVTKVVAESPLVVFGKRDCIMCIVVEDLLLRLAVNPLLCYFDEEDESLIGDKLSKISGVGNGPKLEFPAVFVAGRLLGGVEEVISTHIAGVLVPMLKEANVLWL